MIGLRAAAPGDAATIAAIYAPHVTDSVVSFELEAPDAVTMRQRMAGSDGLYPWIVAAEEEGAGDVLGYAYAGQFSPREAYRWTVETTIYVADRAHRRGLGRTLYVALIATLRAQGFRQAIGRVALPNDASVRLHEAMGFRSAGVFRDIGWKHGRWIDVGYWQRPLAEPSMPPSDPIRFAETGVVVG